MMKKRLLKLLLVGGLVISSVISLNSCKKNKESNEDLKSLPTIETSVAWNRDFGFYCPYCGATITPGTTDHWHLFGTIYGHDEGFEVDACERAYNIPEGYHFCGYAAEGRPHRHNIVYNLDGGTGPDGYITNSWHVGGGGIWP